MKKLKTWEIWKMMDEDYEKMKGKEFRFIGGVTKEKYIEVGEIVQVGKSLAPGLFKDYFMLTGLTGFEEWEEVKESVTFQEAVEAWCNGKSFIVEYRGRTFEQIWAYKLGCLFDENKEYAYGFEQAMLEEGKFYVKD